MEKSEARRLAKEYRKSLDPTVKTDMDGAITRAFLSLDEVKNARKICVYLSIHNEVDTSEIISTLIASGKTLYAPVVVGDYMIAKTLTSTHDLKQGAFGILEPQGDTVNPSEFDLIIVPMVAFNANLARIGYGKGYYDRFLPNGVKTIGLAYSGQKFDFTPQSFDKPLDIIVTNDGVLYANNCR